ncbi:hypothetical protein A2U01_0059773, partial [Trifolium medium]|nr:hypothetical protein [Trifolium medium]
NKLYGYFAAQDEDLWDVVLDDCKMNVDKEGHILDAERRALTKEQKKIYMNHHRAKNIIIDALSFAESRKIPNKSTA